jgi:transcriptional regulator with XRE-family HTH domain
VSRLAELHRVKTLKDARRWLGLSLNELAKKIKPTGDRPQLRVSKSLIAKWENGTRTPSDEQVRRVGELVANKLTADFGFTIGVKVKVNSPWRITAWRMCVVCRRWFEMKRDTSRRCARCVRRGKR